MVLDQHDRQPALGADPPDERAERADLLVIEPARGLIEEQELRTAGQRPRELDALERGERQAGGGMVRDRAEIEELQELLGIGPAPGFFPRDPAELQRVR